MTTAKKAAAAPKKTAASAPASDAKTNETTTTPETTETEGQGNDETASDESDSTAARSGSVETGPQTGVPAAAENTARPPATIVNETVGAAPLDPPADQHTQRQPEAGHKTSSTDHTYAEVGGQTIAGENLVQLVGVDGEPIDIDTLFHRESNRHTHVVATQRVYEKFTYQGAKTHTKRLIFPEGARVPLAQALRIEAAAKADTEAAASDSE